MGSPLLLGTVLEETPVLHGSDGVARVRHGAFTWNVDPLIDGRLTVRLMRRVDWTC